MVAARPAAAALVGYLALSFLFWGRLVAGDFGSHIIAINAFDPSEFIWLYAWWPHALLHGQDPVVTHVIGAPQGYNLAWATSVPGLSYAFAPVTLIFGPVVTWNVVALCAPALSAWTAFLLCRHITNAIGPSLLGGYLFGFSSYMVVHMQGLPQLTFTAMVPVIVLLVVRHLDGSLADRRFVVTIALALAAQFLVSIEILFTTALIGGLVLLGAFFLAPRRRVALVKTAGRVATAIPVMALLVSPILLLAFLRPHLAPDYAINGAAADPLSWFVPNQYFQALSFGSHDYASGVGYLGVPLIVLIALFARERWRDVGSRIALLAIVAASMLSLGTRLRIGGSATHLPLPWVVFHKLPFLKYATPVRFSLLAFLAVAVIASTWLARRGGIARWTLAAVCVATLLPNVVGSSVWSADASSPRFFSSTLHRRYLSTSDRVLVVPVVGQSLRWHAAADFGFTLVGGAFAVYPDDYTRQPIWFKLVFSKATAADAASFRRFVADLGVTVVVLSSKLPVSWRALVATLGVRPRQVGGVLVYRLRPS